MNRRQFLAVTGLAAASGAVSQATTIRPAGDGQAELFKTIDFSSDGLNLTPREYSTLLTRLTASGKVAADEYCLGGLVEEIELKFAQLLGKERAIFLPTGTLANHIAVRKLAGVNRRVLLQYESHLYNDEGDCAETLSGLNLIPLARGKISFELSDVIEAVERSSRGRVETRIGVISIESPVRHKDHAMFDFKEMVRICEYARQHDIRLHLDGARMFNLPHHSGKSLKDYASLFDTVYVSLWKHFNGASGAILASSSSFIDGLFHTRRMFGGSLPHAWPGVALVPQYLQTYQNDYEAAWRTADNFLALLGADERFTVHKIPDGTSKFKLMVSGVSPEVLPDRLLKRGVVVPRPEAGTGVFTLQVNSTLLRMTPQELFRSFIDSVQA